MTRLITDSVRQYLIEIGRKPLLTAAEEIELGHKVGELVRLEEIRDRLTELLQREPSIEEWTGEAGVTEKELNEAIATGRKARNQIVEGNLRLVVSVVKKYPCRGLDFLSLVQEGNIGLQKAAEKFDPSMGYKFSTYAYWWIRQSVTRAIGEKSRTIRLPIHVTEKLNKYKKAYRELSTTLGRTPTTAEVANEAGVTTKELLRVTSLNRRTQSLHTRIGKDLDCELIEVIPDENSQIELDDSKDELERYLKTLSPREREVIEARFGLITGNPKSLSEIGRDMSVSRERIRQIAAKAMRRLQHIANKGHSAVERP